jgi:hypothetical protein
MVASHSSWLVDLIQAKASQKSGFEQLKAGFDQYVLLLAKTRPFTIQENSSDY